jgi:hypothetical protein
LSERELIGVVAVDSGRIVIGDPAYADIARSQPAEDHNPDGGQLGLCVTAPNFGGDGVFPVYATHADDGQLEAVTVYLKRWPDPLVAEFTPEYNEASEFWQARGRHYVQEQRVANAVANADSI